MIDITPDDVVAEIYMYTNNYPCILVEGDNDYNFFSAKKYPEIVNVVPAGGCENVIAAISIIETEGRKRALGIIDKDYRECFGRIPESLNIVVTDNRDLDAMFFSSELTFKKVLLGRVSADKLKKYPANIEGIRDHVVDVAKTLGALRVFSEGKEMYFSFKKMDYDKFIESKEVQFITDSFLSHLRGAHVNNTCISCDHLVAADSYVKEISTFVTELDICKGHDLMAILAIGLRKKWGTHSSTEMKKEIMEELFRLAYPDAEYETTALYSGINDWFARA